MAALMTWIKEKRATVPGKIAEALVYALMAALVLCFFSGNGEFIYEAF